LDQPLTIVLPMHNQERRLRSIVLDVLELTELSCSGLEIILVDDGSTDDTYETACEMARAYPQISVLRQPYRQGMRGILELVRNRLSVEIVLVHDGVSAFNLVELKHLLNMGTPDWQRRTGNSFRDSKKVRSNGSPHFSTMGSLQANMEQAHRTICGFCWLRLEQPLVPRRRRTTGKPQVAPQQVRHVPVASFLPTLPPGTNVPTNSWH